MEEGEKNPVFADVTEIGFSVRRWPSPSGVPTQVRLSGCNKRRRKAGEAGGEKEKNEDRIKYSVEQ